MRLLIIFLACCLPVSAQIKVGGEFQLSALCTYTNTVTKLVTTLPCTTKNINGDVASWNSATPKIATVDTTGMAVGVAPGNTQITATVGKIKSAALTLTVAPKLNSVSISGKNGSTVTKGKTLQMEATCVYSDGSRVNCNASNVHSDSVTRWEISTNSKTIANIDSTGLITGVVAGNINVFAYVDETMTSNVVKIIVQ